MSPVAKSRSSFDEPWACKCRYFIRSVENSFQTICAEAVSISACCSRERRLVCSLSFFLREVGPPTDCRPQQSRETQTRRIGARAYLASRAYEAGCIIALVKPLSFNDSVMAVWRLGFCI